VAVATAAAVLVPGLALAVCAAAAGDASYATSAGTLTQTITRTRTALTERIRLSPQQAITVTATLTSSGRPLGGQPVSFGTGPTQLCTPDTSITGVATCVLTGPQALLAEHDTDTIRARYPGSTGYRPSSTAAVPPPLP
jgi:Bacterial Ig-like domain (group 3)